MKKNVMRIIAVVLAFTMLTVSFAGCSTSEVERPVAVESKTDLKDVAFKFTYGELKEILPGDKLATLYENFNKRSLRYPPDAGTGTELRKRHDSPESNRKRSGYL